MPNRSAVTSAFQILYFDGIISLCCLNDKLSRYEREVNTVLIFLNQSVRVQLHHNLKVSIKDVLKKQKTKNKTKKTHSNHIAAQARNVSYLHFPCITYKTYDIFRFTLCMSASALLLNLLSLKRSHFFSLLC